MDAFTQLAEGSTTGDAELMDIRAAFDGKTYPTAGDSVRGQCGELYDNLYIDTPIGSLDSEWDQYNYIKSSATQIKYTSNTTRLSLIKTADVIPGQIVKITCPTGAKYRAFFFANEITFDNYIIPSEDDCDEFIKDPSYKIM